MKLLRGMVATSLLALLAATSDGRSAAVHSDLKQSCLADDQTFFGLELVILD
jgi:hypothetical protein